MPPKPLTPDQVRKTRDEYKARAALMEKANQLAGRFHQVITGRPKPEGYKFYSTRTTPDARVDRQCWDLAVVAVKALLDQDVVVEDAEDEDES